MSKWELRGWLAFLVFVIKMNDSHIGKLGIISAILFGVISIWAFIIDWLDKK